MKSEKGQSLVEFALILPLLLLLVIGIIDFGRVFHAYITIDHAGREAARKASIETDNGITVPQIQTYAGQKAAGIDTSKLTVGVTYDVDSEGNKENVNIAISYPVQIFFPFIGAIINNTESPSGEQSIELNDTTTMRVE